MRLVELLICSGSIFSLWATSFGLFACLAWTLVVAPCFFFSPFLGCFLLIKFGTVEHPKHTCNMCIESVCVCVCVYVCVCVFVIQVFIVTPSPKERKVCLFSWVVQKNVCHQIFDSSLVSSAKAKSYKFTKDFWGANHGHKQSGHHVNILILGIDNKSYVGFTLLILNIGKRKKKRLSSEFYRKK